MMALEHILPPGAVITLLTVEAGRVMLGFMIVQGFNAPKGLTTAFMGANKTVVLIQVSIRRTSLPRTSRRVGSSNRIISKFIVLVRLVAAVRERTRIRQDTFMGPAVSHTVGARVAGVVECQRSSLETVVVAVRVRLEPLNDKLEALVVRVSTVRGCRLHECGTKKLT
jgi:hypothetical protein